MSPREHVAPPEQRFEDFRRVTWPPGDPERMRARWSRDARAFAKSMKRPVVVALIAAIEPVLHATEGYAWISNEALRDDLGSKHVSAVERALLEAAKLGVIERETTTISAPSGMVLGRKRRIFATRHRGLDETAEQNRARKDARVASRKAVSEHHRTTNPEFRGNSPYGNNELAEAEDGRMTEPRIPPPRSLNRTPSESGNNQEPPFSFRKENTARPQSRMGEVGVRGGAPPHVASVIDAFAFIGPDCRRDPQGEFGGVLEAGRRCWKALRDPRTTPPDAAVLLAEARDAVRRSWTDHDPQIVAMLEHLTAAASRIDRLQGRREFRGPNPTTATGGR